MNSFFRKLFLKIKKHRLFVVFSLSLFLIIILGFFNTVKAQGMDSNVFDSSIVGFLLIVFGKLLNLLASVFFKLTMFFMKAFITFAAYNNFINTPIVMLGWIMVRDLANLFFIVILLFVAFGTILGLDQYEWKKQIFKLILVAVFINFSNVFCQLLIDIAHIFTMSFLNAISAAAGGNLIDLFRLNEIYNAVSNSSSDAGTIELFIGTLLAATFAGIAALSIGVYTIMMLIRVVVLWVLIILSPLAFIFYAFDPLKSKAQEWWNEFSKYVISAPLMVFFLWLGFATLAQGSSLAQIESGLDPRFQLPKEEVGFIYSVSSSAITSWENLAIFLIATVFLWVGIQKVQELGTVGGGMINSGIGFVKKAIGYASGYILGRYLYEKGLEKSKVAGSFGLKFAGEQFYYRTGLAKFVGWSKSGLAKYWKEFELKKVEKAKSLEQEIKKNKGKGGLAAAQNMLNRVRLTFQPLARIQKQIKDYEEAAKAYSEMWKADLSTSSTGAGQAKLRALAEKEDRERKAKSKILVKIAELKEGSVRALNNVLEQVLSEEDFKRYITGDVKTKKEILKNNERKINKKAKELKQQASDEEKRFYDSKNLELAREIAIQQTIAAEAKAKGEVVSEKLEDEMRISEAKMKDRELINQGIAPYYEDLVRSEITKRNIGRLDALNFRQLTTGAINQSDKIIVDNIAEMEQKDKTQQLSAASYIVANLNKGTENGDTVINELKKKLGFRKEFKADDYLSQQALIVSMLTGVKANALMEGDQFNADKIETVFKAWKKKMDNDAVPVLKEFDGALKKYALDGGINLSGLLYDKEFDDKGRMDINLTNLSAQQGENSQEFTNIYRDYFSERINIRTLTGVGSAISRTANGRYSINDSRSIENLKRIFASITPYTEINSALLEDIKKLAGHIAGQPEEIRRVNELYEQLKQTYGENKAEVIREKLQPLFSLINQQNQNNG